MSSIRLEYSVSLSSSVKQDPTAHRYYPVFIRDWAPIEPIGMIKGAGPQPPASYPDPSYKRGRPDHKRPRSGYDSSRSRSVDSRAEASGYETDRSQLSEYSRYKKEERERKEFYKQRGHKYRKQDTKGTHPTNQGPILRNMAPHPSGSNKIGTNKGTLACFVVKINTTPNLWTAPQETSTIRTGPQIGMLLRSQPKAQAHALETRPGQSPNPPPTKYAHMAQGERGRTPY
jgi:hypothetical protein